MLYVIFAVVFGAVAAGSYAWLRPGDDTVGRRIRPAGGSVAPESRYQGSFSSRVLAPAFAGLGRRLANLLPQNIVRNLNAMLIAANEPVTLPIFLAVWLAFSATGFLLFAWVISTSDGMTPLRTIVLAVAVLPTAAFLPYVWMQHKVRVRQKQIVRELPDALDLLVTCVEAGIGVDAAFGLVADQTEGPLADTVRLYLRQVGLGRSRRDALVYVADRTGVQDLIGLAASVAQGEELGTSIADVLRRQAEDLRVSRRQRAQAAAQRAPVLMTIPLVLCFMPAMAAVVVIPSILNLIDFTQTVGK